MKSSISLLVILWILLVPRLVQAQLAPERTAWNNLGKERWAKTEQQVQKALRKDSLNLGANYVYAWFFFTTGNPQFHIDSAALHTARTLHYFNRLNKKEKEKALRFPFDSTGLFRLKELIDSAAFQRATTLNTEVSYTFFIDHYPSALQWARAIELRHEVAYLDALKQNTYQVYASYLERYPHSQRREEAKNRYDKLLFEAKTKDKKLNSYAAFVKDYPQSPYRMQAEQAVFELATASGAEHTFRQFLTNYPDNVYTRQARNYLYHLTKEQHSPVLDFMNDSLRVVQEQERHVWFPVWKNGMYGFMDAEGNERPMKIADSLSTDVLCEGLSHDVLWAGDKVLARNEKVLALGVEDFTDLGSGFIKIKTAEGTRILHKSGRLVLAQDASLLGKHFFVVKGAEQQTVYTLTGRKIISGNWLELVSLGTALAFKTDKGWQLVTLEAMGAVANGAALVFTDSFDEVQRFTINYLLVRNGTRYALLDNRLQSVLPPEEQKITEEEGIVVVRKKNGAHLLVENRLSPLYRHAQVTKQWLLTVTAVAFVVENRLTNQKFLYDSAAFLLPGVSALRNDTLFVHTEAQLLSFPASAKVEVLSAGDVSLFSVQQGNSRIVFSSLGEKLTTLICDRVEYVGGGVLLMTKKDKKSLVDLNGKSIGLTEFETFGNLTARDMAVLYKKKFGLIHTETHRYIKPAYERSLRSYNDELIVAYKNGFYGFINWDNKPLSKFEFEEVRYWNDSVAMVRLDFSWRLLRLEDMTFQLGKINSYTESEKTSGEKIALYRQDNYYGVMSNQQGVIIEPTYTDILNLGTADEPLYFTEKFVEEAAIYVVLYYSGEGKQLRRQVFEEEEYSRIKCVD